MRPMATEVRSPFSKYQPFAYSNFSFQTAAAICHSTPSNLVHALTGTPVGFSVAYAHMKALVNSTAMDDFIHASPNHFIGPNCSPIAFTQGNADRIVPPICATEMQHHLVAASVPHLYLSYGGGHVFNGLPLSQIIAIEQQTETWA